MPQFDCTTSYPADHMVTSHLLNQLTKFKSIAEFVTGRQLRLLQGTCGGPQYKELTSPITKTYSVFVAKMKAILEYIVLCPYPNQCLYDVHFSVLINTVFKMQCSMV